MTLAIPGASFQGTEILVGEKKFLKHKYTSIDNKTIVAFTEVTDQADPFTIKASIEGLELVGKYKIEDDKALDRFAWLISQAQKEVLTFKKALSRKLSGNLSEH